MQTLVINKEEYEKLITECQTARSHKNKTFLFQNKEIYVSYAKFLIYYLGKMYN